MNKRRPKRPPPLLLHRRRVLQATAALAAASVLAAPSVSQSAGPRVVVIGGGFGGASCARTLKRIDSRISVTLVEAKATYTAMPGSSAVIAGLTNIDHQKFSYRKIENAGIAVVVSSATSVDPGKHSVTLATGSLLTYDRLVLSPGIEFRTGAISGYDRKTAELMPAAWSDSAEVTLLRRQLEAMEDGGTVVITSPVNPARCPPAPYERASLIAYYLKNHKPKSKVIILDAKDSFTMQKLFEAAWRELYPGMIEWVGLSGGGALTAVEPSTNTLVTDFEKYKASVANIIPPQKAGRIADLAGVADRTGWCPVDPISFESKLQSNIHVIGDAAIAGAMPRSAAAAQSQGAICAAAIAAQLTSKTPGSPRLSSTCYSLIAPDYAISQRGTFRPVDGQYAEADGGTIVSPPGASRVKRKTEAEEAEGWYHRITTEVFG